MEEGRGGRGEGQEMKTAARGGKGRSANERGLMRSKKMMSLVVPGILLHTIILNHLFIIFAYLLTSDT